MKSTLHNCYLILVALVTTVFFTNGVNAQAVNLAPAATASAAPACNLGPCTTLNDLNFGTCGSQQMWITSGATNPGSAVNITFTWSSPQVVRGLTIHAGGTGTRYLGGGTIEIFNGSSWVAHHAFTQTNTSLCNYDINFNPVACTALRIVDMVVIGSQSSNVNFREIEIWRGTISNNDIGVVAIDTPGYTCFTGTQRLVARLINYGLNQITSANVNWSVNGVVQTPVSWTGVMDTFGGASTPNAWVFLDTINLSSPKTVVAWTSLPNGVADTITNNDSNTAVMPGISGALTVGSTGAYPTIRSALNAIRSAGICGNVTILLTDTFYSTGTGETFPIEIGSNFPGLSANNRIVIKPDSGIAVTIFSNAAQVFNLNGARFISIDGRWGNSSSGRNLTIMNTLTTGVCLVMQNDAMHNIIRNVNFRSANTSNTSGALVFSGSSATNGNDSNFVLENYFSRATTGNYNVGIFSQGSSNVVQNNNNTISGNEFNSYTFNGINISATSNGNGSNWVISNNHFYDTSVNTTHTSVWSAINFAPGASSGSGNNRIENNFIGGSQPFNGGAPLTAVTTGITRTLIQVTTPIGQPNIIRGNVIRNIYLPVITGTGTFTGIQVSAGFSVIDSNTIDSILSFNNAVILGINYPVTANQTITRNIIKTITLFNNSTSGAIRGITVSGGQNVNISNNIIRGFRTNSNNTGQNTGAPIIGILSSATSNTITIANNQIGTLDEPLRSTHNSTGNICIVGILSSSGTSTIIGNVIDGLFLDSTAQTSASTSTGASINGILNFSGSAGQIIRRNTVRHLFQRSNSTTQSSQMNGICYASSGFHTIDSNIIYGLWSRSTNTSSSTSAALNGINIASSGRSLIDRNYIDSLALIRITATGGQVNGILGFGTTGNRISFNTIRHLYINVTNTSAAACGINYVSSVLNQECEGNQISSLINTNATSTATFVGIRYISTSTIVGNNSFCNRNFIHSFTSNSTNSFTMNGIEMSSGTATLANNVIRLGLDSAGNPYTGPYAINGILCSVSGTTQPVRFYHNTVYVAGTPNSGTQITTAINFNSIPLVDMRNNILVNRVRNIGTSTNTNFVTRHLTQPLTGSIVNYNILWADTFTGNFISGGFITNTNTMYGTTGLRYNGRMEPNGTRVDPVFINADGPAGTFDLSLATINPGAGQGDPMLTDPVLIDFSGNVRSARTPVDIGAFSSATDVLSADSIGPEITLPVLVNTASITNRTFTCNILDRVSGVAAGTVSPRVYFSKNFGTYQSTVGSLISGDYRNGTWEFTIDYSLVGGVLPNDNIRYYVIAQDSTGILVSNAAGAVAPSVDVVITHATNTNQYTISTPIPTSITVGPTGAYPSLTGTGGLFAAINNSLLQGNTTVLLDAGTITEDGTNQLNQWLEFDPINGTVGNFGYTLTIRPATNTQTILSGTAFTFDGMIRLNGADRVSILGFSPSGSTSDTNLVVRNLATSQPCLTFLNDASNNNLVNVVFETANTNTSVTNGGAVRISQSSLITGNDNIRMSGCHLRWLGTGTIAGILFTASGTTGVNRENDNLTIENCTFNNFNSSAISISTGTGNNQVIKNNRFFMSPGVFHTTSPTVINFTPGGLSNNDTISGNIIGGAAFTLDTSMWRPSLTAALTVTGINVTAGAVTGTFIANNRIANIEYRLATASTFTGIQVNNGGGVASILNNYIGDTATADNILHGGNATMLMISCQTGSNAFINNNRIANITNINPNGASVVMNGIRAWNQTAILQINNNNITNLRDSSSSIGSSTSAPMLGINISSATNSIQVDGNYISNLANNSVTAATTSQVLGIFSSSGLPVITNNIVERLTSRSLNTSSSTGATLIGIWSGSGTAGQTISNNTVRELLYSNSAPASTQVIGIMQSSGSGHTISNNLVFNIKSNSISLGTGAAASIIGIMHNGSGATINIVGNRIHTLENINTTPVSANIVGIFMQNTTTAVYSSISRNFIHSFRLSSSSVGRMIGIHQNSGSFVRHANNMIRLGIDSSGTAFSGPYEVYGILTEVTGNFDYYHNSIFIGGAPSTGASLTAAIRVTGTPTGTQNYDIRNNILVNAVSNTGTATGKNFGLRIATIPSNPAAIVSNYNVYGTPGTGGFIAGTNTVDYPNLNLINGWKTLTGYDLQSGSGNPLFIDATATADLVDLHLQSSNPCEASGDAAIASLVTTDFDGQTRSGQTPHDIGADAGTFTLSSDIIAPVISFTPLSNQGNITGPLPLTNVNIRDNAGIPLTGNMPRLYYRKGIAGSYVSVPPVSQSGTPFNANFTFDIDYGILAGVTTGDTIFYYVLVEDSVGSNMISGAPFAVATNVTTVVQHPLLPNSYTILPVIPSGTKFYVGIGQPYTNLTGTAGLFQFLNSSTIGGPISAVITSNITEPGTVQLLQIGEDGPGSGTFTFTIAPDSSATTPRIISGSVSGVGMLVLNGADRVKITGIPDQSVNSTLRQLIMRNSGGPTINFINGSQQCRLNNLIIEGTNPTSATAVNQGLISFAGTNNTFGNSQDSITNCILRNNTLIVPPSGVPAILIGSFHTGLVLNSNNVITNNDLSNASSVYVNVEVGSGNGWIVSNNSLFNSLPPITTIPLPIRFNGGILSEGHTIANNIIGGTAPNAGGSPWTTNVFAGWNQIQLAVGLNLTTNITGNIIRNLSWPQNASANQWNGIIASSGRLNISNNMFGDSTVSGSIFLASPTTHNGIAITGTVTSPVTISGNRFAGLSFISPGNAIGFNAISLAGGIATVSNNIIGATGVANTILHDGNSQLRGINITTAINIDPAAQITNNIIANMSSVASMPSAGVGAIQQTGTTVSNISGNRIFNISSMAANTGLSPTAPSVFGIGVSATINPGMLISNNTIYGIIAANTDPLVTNSFGIAVQSANGIVMSRNRIYDIRNLSSSTSQNPMATANGIAVFGMQNKIDIFNNQITLGNGQNNNVQYNGIWQNTSGGFDVNCYYNTVLVTGTVSAGSVPSYAFHRGQNATFEITSTTRLYNNAFINHRSGGSSKNYSIANEVAGTPSGSGWQESGYNLLSSSASSTVGLWGSADRDIAQWRTSTNADRSSWSVTSAAVNPSSVFTDVANGNLNIVTTAPQSWYMNGKGIAGATSFNINTDFNGNARGITQGFGTDIGAHEFTTSATPPAVTFTGAIAYNGNTVVSFANRDLATISWGGLGVLPSSLSGAYFSGTTPPNSFPAARHLNAYLNITTTGGTGYIYNMTLNYDLALLGNVLSQTDLRVARNATGTWSVDNTSTVNTVSRTVTTGSPFNAFGAFTATDATSPLPVQLVSFEGRALANDAVLNWSTASELNSDLFEIERSADAVNFEYTGSVTARGNSNVRIDYTYTDADALATQPVMYYRLKQIDKDGTFTYSKTVQVSKLATNTSSVTVYPNPFEGNLNIAIQSTVSGIAHAALVDLQGRTVMSFDWNIHEGLNVIPVEATKQIQKGVYFVRIELNGEVNTHKVVNIK